MYQLNVATMRLLGERIQDADQVAVCIAGMSLEGEGIKPTLKAIELLLPKGAKKAFVKLRERGIIGKVFSSDDILAFLRSEKVYEMPMERPYDREAKNLVLMLKKYMEEKGIFGKVHDVSRWWAIQKAMTRKVLAKGIKYGDLVDCLRVLVAGGKPVIGVSQIIAEYHQRHQRFAMSPIVTYQNAHEMLWDNVSPV